MAALLIDDAMQQQIVIEMDTDLKTQRKIYECSCGLNQLPLPLEALI